MEKYIPDLGMVVPSCHTRCKICKHENMSNCWNSDKKFEPFNLEELEKRIEEYYCIDDSNDGKLAGAMRAAAEEHNYPGVFMLGYAAALKDVAEGYHKDVALNALLGE